MSESRTVVTIVDEIKVLQAKQSSLETDIVQREQSIKGLRKERRKVLQKIYTLKQKIDKIKLDEVTGVTHE